MFTRHHIGPATELGRLNLLAEVKYERRIALATAQETSPRARSGASAPTLALNRIVNAARSLRLARFISVFGMDYPSRPQ